MDDLQEQAVVDGVLCTRSDEHAPWVAMTPQELTEIVLELRKRLGAQIRESLYNSLQKPGKQDVQQIVHIQYVSVPQPSVARPQGDGPAPFPPGTIIC